MNSRLFSIMLLLIFIVAGCSKAPKAVKPVEEAFEIILERSAVEFAFNQSQDVYFDVIGVGAVGLSLTVVVPDGWSYRVEYFEQNGHIGVYTGTVVVTSPGRESSGTMKIAVVNDKGLGRQAEVNMSAVPEPLEVNIELPDETPLLELSESRSVPFAVTCNNPVELTAEVSATDSWDVKLERFAVYDGGAPSADYIGSMLLTAPDVKSSSEITITIKNPSGAVVESAKFGARCDRISEADARLDISTGNMNFAFSQTRTAEFTVEGEDAVNLTAAVEPPLGWTADIVSFEEYSYGYLGVVSITAPHSESEGEVVIEVAGDGIDLSGTIDVASAPFGLRFEEESYIFDIYEFKTINYTVSGTDGHTIESADIACPDGWYVDYGVDASPPSFVWDEGQDRYRGGFRIRSGVYPEDGVVSVRLTDRDGRATDWPVDVVCGDGTPIPVPKQAANCIVVDRVGEVSFDARKGDGTPVAGNQVKWIWADSDNLIVEGSPAYSGGKITFTTAPFSEGNMLIGLFDSAGNIVWTWHIWFVDGLNLNASAGEFMNMALGAVSAARSAGYGVEDVGLLYQWGRKEPFPRMADKLGFAEESSGAFQTNTKPVIMASGYSWGFSSDAMDTHDKAVLYPTRMAAMVKNMPSSAFGPWDAVADPCPKGWRVPNRKELQAYWAVSNPDRSHTWYEYEGIIPAGHRNDWWAVTGLRATGADMQGALRLNNYLYYWSNTSSGFHTSSGLADLFNPANPADSSGDEGYLQAAAISNQAARMESTTGQKSDAMSVRCIKE